MKYSMMQKVIYTKDDFDDPQDWRRLTAPDKPTVKDVSAAFAQPFLLGLLLSCILTIAGGSLWVGLLFLNATFLFSTWIALKWRRDQLVEREDVLTGKIDDVCFVSRWERRA